MGFARAGVCFEMHPPKGCRKRDLVGALTPEWMGFCLTFNDQLLAPGVCSCAHHFFPWYVLIGPSVEDLISLTCGLDMVTDATSYARLLQRSRPFYPREYSCQRVPQGAGSRLLKQGPISLLLVRVAEVRVRLENHLPVRVVENDCESP